MTDYTKEYAFAKKVALECGQTALKYYNKNGGAAAKQGVTIDEKVSATDLVTAGDKASERHFIDRVNGEFPDHLVLGEENSAAVSENLKNAETAKPAPKNLKDLPTNSKIWIIDPIDGTMSFVHGFEFWCVSIGLVADGEIILGVIYQPTKNLLYHAIKGQGSFCENLSTGEVTKLSVSQQTTVKGSLYASALASNYMDLNRKALLSGVHGIRAVGATALMMCDIASGCCDFYSHIGIHSWDVCAGARIILEAGGFVYNHDFGGEFDLFERKVGACATKELAKDVFEKLGEECSVGPASDPNYQVRDVLAYA